MASNSIETTTHYPKNLRTNTHIRGLMKIVGKVISGTGEGAFYVEKYMPYLESVLGFTCHPGTLNVNVGKKPEFNGFKKWTIKPEEEELEEVDCYLVTIGEYDGAIVIPHKTRHGEHIIEIVSAVNLREEMKLKDGDEVTCELV